MAVQIACIAFVFGIILKVDWISYISYLSVGIVSWNFMSATLTDAPRLFAISASLIKQSPVPLLSFVVRSMWKNLVIFGHNLAILPIVWLIAGAKYSLSAWLVVPGIAVVIVNLIWVSVVLGTLGALFQDIQQLISPVMTVLFYLTPVMWFPELLNDSELAHYVLGLNPFYHLLQLIRLPLLGQFPTFENWFSAISLAIIGAAFAAFVYKANYKKISLAV